MLIPEARAVIVPVDVSGTVGIARDCAPIGAHRVDTERVTHPGLGLKIGIIIIVLSF